jgi:hypothetical protein
MSKQQDRRLFTRREIDRKNQELMEQLDQEVKRLRYLGTAPEMAWVCQKTETGRVLAVGQTKDDVINFMKSMCQFFSVRTETNNNVTGHYKTKTNPEEFEFEIVRFKILQDIKPN